MSGVSVTPAKKIVLPELTREQLKVLSELVLREGATGEVRSTLNIGRILLIQVFRGSEQAFRDRHPRKTDSLRDLAAQPGMAEAGWGRTRLRNAIELSLLAKVHNDLRAWRYLRVSHYEAIFGLPAERQRELLDQANKEHWSVDRLSAEAGRPRAANAAAGAMSADEAQARIPKLVHQLAPLAAPATAVDAFLVPTGIDAEDVAEFTATMEKGLVLLRASRSSSRR
jgi:hypothetical protein